jgi:hypothetical protein
MVVAAVGAAASTPTIVGAVLGWSGFFLSAMQCMNAVVRAHEAYTDPLGNALYVLDNDERTADYRTFMNFVSAAGDLVGAAQLGMAVRGLLRAAGSLRTLESLTGLSPAERAREIESALTRAAATPAGRRAIEDAYRAAGLSRPIGRGLAAGAANAAARPPISPQAATALMNRLNAAIGEAANVAAGVGALAMSGMPSSRVGGASGAVNTYVVNPVAVHVLHIPAPQ